MVKNANGDLVICKQCNGSGRVSVKCEMDVYIFPYGPSKVTGKE